MTSEETKRLLVEAQSFIASLSVFLLKKRDEETNHLLNTAKILIEALIRHNKLMSPVLSTRHGNTGQCWEELMLHKGKREDLNRFNWGPTIVNEALSNGRQKNENESEVLKEHKTQMQKCEHQSTNSAIADQYTQTKEGLDTAHSTYSALENLYRQTKEELDTAHSTYSALENLYRQTKEELDTARSTYSALENLYRQTKEELDTAHSTYSALENLYRQTKEQLDTAHSTYSALENLYRQTKVEVSTAPSANSVLEDQCRQTKEDLNAAHSNNSVLEDQCTQTKEEISTAPSANSVLEDECRQTKEDLNAAHSNNSVLEDECRQTKEDLNAAHSNNSVLEDQCTQTKEEISTAPSANSVLEDECRQTKEDLNAAHSNNSVLEDECRQTKEDLNAAHSNNSVLEDECRQTKKDLNAVHSNNSVLENQCTQTKEEINTAQSRNNASDDQHTQTKAATVRMSADKVQGHKRLDDGCSLSRTDNRKTFGMSENVNEHCRPSIIAMNYNTLESQQWVDAKEELEAVLGSQMDEKQITRVLCQAFMNIYDAARHVYVNLEHVIGELLARPTFAMELVENRVLRSDNLNVLTTEMADLVKQKLRQTVNTLEKDVICKRSRLKDPNLEDLVNTSSSRQVVNCFLQECASISWQMIIQSPPMLLAVDDTKFDDAKHKLWWSCDRSHAENVDSFVWPVLFDYEGGHVLVKGCVYAN